ncbi:TetR/AcrR family transcriptional regulator [Xanthobacter sediminis]
MSDPLALPPIDLDDSPPGRILAAARQMLLQNNYSGFTMDDLAFALGMSKKTLYVHFPSKEALGAAVIAATGVAIRRQAGEAMAGPGAFPEKLEAVLGVIGSHIGVMGAGFLQDLARHAPALFREIEGLKERNIPLVIGRILEIGIAEGMVRADIDVSFVVEYWLQIMKGVHEPAVLARTGLTPRAAFERGTEMFFLGLLTDEGRARSRWATATAGPRSS